MKNGSTPLSRSLLKLNRAVLNRAVATLSIACAVTLGALLPFSYVSQAQAAPLENEVYAWGLASFGQLGMSGAGAQREVPTPAPQLAAIHTERGIVDMSAGVFHNIALAADGTMWAWGHGAYGQLGRIGDTSNAFLPVQVPALTTIAQTHGVRQIESGNDHNIMVTDAGYVYVWGRNQNGQLGLTGGNRYTPTRNLTLSTRNIEKVASGAIHSIAVSSEGHVYVWGQGLNGELGMGVSGNLSTPTRNLALTTIVQAQGIRHLSVGARHNILVTNTGRTYVWGQNNQGQLGTGRIVPGAGFNHYLAPTEVPGLTALNIQQIATGSVHSMVIASSGRVYGFGANNIGQLGLGQGVGDANGSNFSPVEITTLTALNNAPGPGIAQIQTRPYTGHTFTILNDGRVFFQGHGGSGTAGNNNPIVIYVPAESPLVSDLVQRGAHLFLGGLHTIAFSPVTVGGEFPLTKVLQKPYATPRPADLTFEFRMRATSFNNNPDQAIINERFPTNSTNMIRSITIDANSASSTRNTAAGDIVELRGSTDILASLNFNRRGVFEWEIYEIIPAVNPVTPPSNLVYSLARYELRVYVRERTSVFGGEFYIYAITLHRLRDQNGVVLNPPVKVGMNDEAELSFTNTYTRRTAANQHLNVHKYIEGLFADLSETFTFTATINRTALCTANTINARIYRGTTFVETITFTFGQPRANITLGHNYRLVFDPLVIGSTFEVVEAACPLHIASVRVYSHAHPTTPLLLENTVPDQPRTTNVHIIGANTNATNFRNVHQFSPPTGLFLGTSTYIVIPLFAAGIITAASLAAKARRRIEDMPLMH